MVAAVGFYNASYIVIICGYDGCKVLVCGLIPSKLQMCTYMDVCQSFAGLSWLFMHCDMKQVGLVCYLQSSE